MGDTCESCGRPAVDSLSLLWRFGETPEDIGEAIRHVGERTAGFCAEHEVAVRARLSDDGWMALRSRPLQSVLTPREEQERAAREKRAELDRQRRAALRAEREAAWEAARPGREREREVRYQRDLTEYKRRFERGLTKRTRIAAAWKLAEHTQEREPAEAARAYEYIAANRPPVDRDQAFEFATRLRVVGSLDAAEQVFRKLRDEDHDSGVQRGRAAEHASFALDSELARQQFPSG